MNKVEVVVCVVVPGGWVVFFLAFQLIVILPHVAPVDQLNLASAGCQLNSFNWHYKHNSTDFPSTHAKL